MALMKCMWLSEKKHFNRHHHARVVTEKRKGQTFDGASPRPGYPTYAGANVGYPDGVGLKEEWMLKPRFILPGVGESR
jgi:hypothetical protein